MNITIFTPYYDYNQAGIYEIVRNLSREIAAKNNRVSIVLFTSKKEIKLSGSFKGVNSYRLYVPFLLPPEFSLKGVIDTVKLILSLPFSLIRLKIILRENNTQIISVLGCTMNAFYAWIISYLTHLPFVVTLQGSPNIAFPFLGKIRLRLIKILVNTVLSKASFVTSCSKYMFEETAHISSAIKNKSLVIPNGIDLSEFNHNGQALINYPYILCLGRLRIPYKGFDLSILAFKDIIDSGLDIKLVIAGDGPDKQSHQDFARLLKIEKNILFFGPADRNQAVNLFKNCEFFLMPSRVEPFGIVNLEAMAAGKAIVAARTGGISEVVEDRVTGLLVEPCSDKALFLGMKQLLEDKDLRDRLGENGRRKIDSGDFCWNVIADRYLEVFKKVLA